jgi:hypothetical protein
MIPAVGVFVAGYLSINKKIITFAPRKIEV